MDTTGSLSLQGNNSFEREHGGRRSYDDAVEGLNPFRGEKATNAEGENDDEALLRAALEQLPTGIRAQTAVIGKEHKPLFDPIREALVKEGGQFFMVDVKHLTAAQREHVVSKALQTSDQDNERFLQKWRERMDRVDLELPKVEVAYRNLTIEANVYVGSRALPTLINSVRNIFEDTLSTLRLKRTNKRKLTILNNISGVLKPGRLTLLLGPPSSGKSTLLLALAGKATSDLKLTGEILYNGHRFDEFVAKRTAAYVPQNDKHIGELTVRETLDFAAQCQGVGDKEDMLQELSRREVRKRILPDPDIDAYMKAAAISGRQHSVVTEYVQKILGLDICADTIVGNEMLRGISGGQRKRVTTGEMIVGSKKVLFMDEISTGLDSATTYQIVRCIRNFVHLQDATVLVSLLQPAPEAFEQFDDVILLSEGSLVYHGPRGRILEFFEMLGFRCPERKGIADFLQEVTSLKDQQQYWARSTPYKFVPVNAFAEAFQKWDLGRELTAAAAAPYDKEGGHRSALVRTQYALRSWDMFKATMKREWTLMVRNRFLYIFRTFQVFYVSLITSTLFFRTTLAPNSVNDGNLYLGVLFFSLIFMMFNGFSEMSIMIARLPVFYKQRDNNFFPGWAFNLPIAILRVPYSVVEAIVWSCVVYWVVGLAPEAGRFFTFMLIMFLMHNLSVSLFRLIGAVSRSMVLANTFGAFIILLVFLLGGFIIDKRDIEPWWVWAYWIVPLSYAQNAVAVNEFTAPRWNKPYQYNYVHGTNNTLGQTVLQSRAIHEANWWIWLGVGVMAAYVIIFNVGVSLALAYLPPVGRPQAVLGEEELRNKEKARQGIDHKGDVEMTSSIAPAGGEAAGAPAADVERGPRELRQAPSMPPVDEDGADVIANGADVHANGAEPNANDADGAHSSTSGDANGVAGGSGIRGGAARIGRKIDLSNSTIQKFQNAGAEIPTTGMILPFEPMAMTFHNVNYYVDMPKNVLDEHGKPRGGRLQLLRNVSGAFRPGVLTALIGVTGAGKTTLLDVLAGRKTGGYIEGELRVGGHPKEQATFARIAGYVEQFDIHSPQTTVHEALQFSAALRLPANIDPTMREQFVEQVMDLVELAPLRNALVGLPGISGLSVEQRKRLTIAVELVANPSIIFMDEPTSGLDARAAAIVMRAVRNVVDTGRTVVCTIHQPSIDIFEAFDELLLMKRGGQVVYAGPLGDHSLRLIEYFQAIEGVPKIKDRYNPATWMLEITTPGAEQRLGRDFADIYHSSALFKQQEALIAELEKPPPGTSPLAFDTVYARSFFDQFRVCFWKNNWTYWRSPQYNTVRFFFTVIVALLFGTIFWNKGTKRGSQQDIFNVMGALYATVLFLGFNNASTVQPVVAVERSVFYREKAAGLYHPLPFAAAQGLVELPYLLVQAAVYSIITYSMIQFEWQAGKFFWFLLFMWLTQCFFTFYGIMAVAITPSQQLAAVISSAFYSIWNLFSGFLIPRPQIPGWWIWYYYLNPMAWTLYGLITSQLGDVSEEFKQEDGSRIAVSAYIKEHFGYHHNLLGLCVGAMVCFVGLFWAVSATAYWRINFQKR